jgi:hypothetical protein
MTLLYLVFKNVNTIIITTVILQVASKLIKIFFEFYPLRRITSYIKTLHRSYFSASLKGFYFFSVDKSTFLVDLYFVLKDLLPFLVDLLLFLSLAYEKDARVKIFGQFLLISLISIFEPIYALVGD